MKIKVLILASLALLLMAGCFDYEQTMVIKKDGSGTAKVRYTVEKAYLEQIKQMSEAMAEQSGGKQPATDPAETMFSKSEIEKALQERDSGIKMLTYEKSETENARIWAMEFSFADVNKLDILADALSADNEEFAPSNEAGAIYARQPNGTWLYSQPFMEDDDDGQEGEESDYEESDDYTDEDTDDEYDESEIGDIDMKGAGEAMENWAEEMKDLAASMASHKIRIAIDFPGEIIESNATSTEGKTAVWEFTLEQMPNAPEELKAVIKQ